MATLSSGDFKAVTKNSPLTIWLLLFLVSIVIGVATLALKSFSAVEDVVEKKIFSHEKKDCDSAHDCIKRQYQTRENFQEMKSDIRMIQRDVAEIKEEVSKITTYNRTERRRR